MREGNGMLGEGGEGLVGRGLGWKGRDEEGVKGSQREADEYECTVDKNKQ